MSNTCQISLTYRGVLGHRGVNISGDSYGKTWTLYLANDLWTLTDHQGDEVYSFTQRDLYQKVALPHSLVENKDLRFVGLGEPIHCFQSEQEVVESLKYFVELSERVNAPELAKWHRTVGIGFLGVSLLSFIVGMVVLSSFLQSTGLMGLLTRPLATTFTLFDLVIAGYFLVVGIRELRKANRFANLVKASKSPDS